MYTKVHGQSVLFICQTYKQDCQVLCTCYAPMLYKSHSLQDAIASCPVDCIHWVEKDQLPALEYVMRNKVPVTDVGTMMGGAGYRADVFAAAASFLKKREKE